MSLKATIADSHLQMVIDIRASRFCQAFQLPESHLTDRAEADRALSGRRRSPIPLQCLGIILNTGVGKGCLNWDEDLPRFV